MKKKRPVEHLSQRQRRLTPLPFCRYLVAGVLARHPSERIAVLWTCPMTNYGKLWPLTDCWGIHRDARLYDGPYPVICHPPCGPWGNYKAVSHESKEHGIIAMDLVHRWGGVVEQPVGSSLFREYGRHGTIEAVNQGDHGHPSIKATLLYWI